MLNKKIDGEDNLDDKNKKVKSQNENSLQVKGGYNGIEPARTKQGTIKGFDLEDPSDLPNHVDGLVTSVKIDVFSVWFRIKGEQKRDTLSSFTSFYHLVFSTFQLSMGHIINTKTK